jgi:hypothetical protein
MAAMNEPVVRRTTPLCAVLGALLLYFGVLEVRRGEGSGWMLVSVGALCAICAVVGTVALVRRRRDENASTPSGR